MYQIMFSLLVHEEPDVILDQIINLNHFNNNCALVLHLNPKFKFEQYDYTLEEFTEKINKFGNVFINNQRLEVGKDDIIQAHISNFQFVKKVDFTYFYFIASNELFIKEGLYKFISQFEYGCEDLLKEKWHYFDLMQKDPDLKKIIKESGNADYSYSQIEGSFYKKELFLTIEDIIARNYDYKKQVGKYPRDEVYFSTIANGLYKEQYHYSSCCCKIRWQGKILFTSLGSIKKILKNDSLHYFSVKRVDRRINDYLRSFVRKTIGQYSDETKKEVKQEVKEASQIKIKMLNLFYLVKYFFRNILANMYRFIFRKK